MMSLTPEVQSPPLTITIDRQVDQYDVATGHFITVMMKQVIPNPALECHDKTPALINVPGAVLAVFVAIVVTWLVSSWWHKHW